MTPELIHRAGVATKHGRFGLTMFKGEYQSMITFDSIDGCETIIHITELDLIAIHTMITDALSKCGVEHA